MTEGLKYSVIRSDGELSGLLQMLATDNNVNILSTPHVMAANNQTALIRVGEEIPVLTQTRNIQGGIIPSAVSTSSRWRSSSEITPGISPGSGCLYEGSSAREKYPRLQRGVERAHTGDAEAQTPSR